jgi:hypothetical protein
MAAELGLDRWKRDARSAAAWVRAHPWRAALYAALVFIVLSLMSCAAQTPRNDRAWYPYLARTTQVELAPERFAVRPVLDWTYDSSGPVGETYTEAAFDFSALRNVWFVLEPQPGSTLAAHTFLLFEFANDRLLGVTIEARRETNEDYSAWDGLFNKYELAYMWGSARDLLTRRAVMLGHDVFMYPTALTDKQKRELLTRLLERTGSLQHQARFYNTLTSNCTNELAKATDLDWHYSFVLTGLSDEHLYDLKLIPGPSFAIAHERSAITGFVRDLNQRLDQAGARAGSGADTRFDAALLAELRRRGVN